MLNNNYTPSLIIALMRGDAQITVELLGNQVMSSLMALPSIAQCASSQELKVLAITGQSRSSVMQMVEQ